MSKSGIKVTFKSKPNALKNVIKNAPITISCPNCNSEIQITGNSIGSNITCPCCNSSITLKDDGYTRELDNLQKSFDKILK